MSKYYWYSIISSVIGMIFLIIIMWTVLYYDAKNYERSLWMKTCVSGALNKYPTNDAAFEHCLKQRQWFEEKQNNGWTK